MANNVTTIPTRDDSIKGPRVPFATDSDFIEVLRPDAMELEHAIAIIADLLETATRVEDVCRASTIRAAAIIAEDYARRSGWRRQEPD